MSETTLETARRYAAAGLSVIPIRSDGTKAPACAWAPFQKKVPTSAQLARWFSSNEVGIAIIGGAVSGGLERMDFDEEGLPEIFEELAEAAGLADLVQSLPRVDTPRGGMHLYYRIADGPAENLKLARAADGTTRIETKGEGGYTITPGSPPACHPAGKPYLLVRGDLAAIPTITPEDRQELHRLAHSLDLAPPAVASADSGQWAGRTLTTSGTSGTALRPGDDYNDRGDYETILKKHGWQPCFGRGEVLFWRRPGKTGPGISGHTGRGGREFWCFSSNGSPFEAKQGYTPFSVYALLEHGGDFKAAARQLGQEGYGSPLDPPRSRKKPSAEPSGTPQEPPLRGTQGGNGNAKEAGTAPAQIIRDDEPDREAEQERRIRERAALAEDTRKTRQAAIQGQLQECIPPTGFLRDFINLYGPTTAMPPQFHLAAGLSVLSAVTNRAIYLQHGARHLFPNLFILSIAETTWLYKSTAIHEAEDTIDRLVEGQQIGRGLAPKDDGMENPYLLELPMSINALGLWAARPRGLILAHELGGWLKQTEKTEYMAGLKAAITELYECKSAFRRAFKTREAKIYLRQPYVSLLGASTVDWLAASLTPEDVQSGFLPRFLFFTASREDRGKGLPFPPQPAPRGQQQVDHALNRISQLIGQATLSQTAQLEYANWYLQNESLALRREADPTDSALRGRAAEHVLKIAMLLHVSQFPAGPLDIQADSIQRAGLLIEYLLERIRVMMREELLSSLDRAIEDRILRVLRKAGREGMTTGDIQSWANVSKKLAEPALESLLEENKVEWVETQSFSGRGRRGKRWFSVL